MFNLNKPFFDTLVQFRCNNDTINKINFLLDNNEEVENISHLIRVAILRMYRQTIIDKKEKEKEVKENEVHNRKRN